MTPPRVAVPAPEAFSRLRHPAVASRVGVWLGACFAVAFLTGIVSHYVQSQPTWLTLPTRPIWLYRVSQGLHVAAGTAAIPLLLVKLWSVYHNLFAAVPWRSARSLVLHLLERASIAVLVAAAIFEVVTGAINITHWYPWEFSFRATHYAVAWIAIGALIVHIAVKLPTISQALSSPIDETDPEADPTDPGASAPSADQRAGLSRRGLVRTALVAAGAAVVATVGSTIPLLREVSVFGVRSGEGPQGVPVNTTAEDAGVVTAARDPDYRLTVVHGARSVSLRREDLVSLPQHTVDLPIACVEGWSATGTWSGVRMRDLLDLVQAPPSARIHVVSLQESGAFNDTEMPGEFTQDPLTLLALFLSGEPLDLDHGYPARLIAPARPGVLQTKWVHRIEVLR
ncbi:molybdopterin-dependent oxidoreductase [Janibacter alittae]|uniref:Molybdopterin-dependent oxidoreductase n=1 Tax=Janibacter alittae TaxID=3115209 RepID=A0ABZ2ML24_9MICO